MGRVDLKNVWMYLQQLEHQLEEPREIPHEETDLHRVFCDEHFCLEQDQPIADTLKN